MYVPYHRVAGAREHDSAPMPRCRERCFALHVTLSHLRSEVPENRILIQLIDSSTAD